MLPCNAESARLRLLLAHRPFGALEKEVDRIAQERHPIRELPRRPRRLPFIASRPNARLPRAEQERRRGNVRFCVSQPDWRRLRTLWSRHDFLSERAS